MCNLVNHYQSLFLFCASGKSHSQAGSASVALCEFSGWKSCWHKILSQSFQLRPKWHRLNPFFIPPLSPVKSIRISFCISTCRSQYLLPLHNCISKWQVLHFYTSRMRVASQIVFLNADCLICRKQFRQMLKCDLRQRERLLRGL